MGKLNWQISPKHKLVGQLPPTTSSTTDNGLGVT